MFLQGEMPRDSFGGESRDLEPFGRFRALFTENSGTVREFFQRRSSTNATVFGADYQNL